MAALSVADPAAMAILGLSPVLPGIVTALEPAGDLLYVSLDSGRVLVLDIEQRTSPVIVNGLFAGGADYGSGAGG
ncbi:MAG: hypothetical protein H6651_01880 [Ardenticatenales bacterium]|nr:hypothetical protein [Ardenticatenales bacterium]